MISFINNLDWLDALYIFSLFFQLHWLAFATASYFGKKTMWWKKYGMRVKGANLLLFWFSALLPFFSTISAIAVNTRIYQIWREERELNKLRNL